MKLIKKIKSPDFDRTEENVRIREAVRAILLDEGGRVGMIFAKNGGFYKLPGGGIDVNESKEVALAREIIEETGYESEIIRDVGYTIEEYPRMKKRNCCMIGKSYVYVARATKFVGRNLMEDEMADGFEFGWVESVPRAIKLIDDAQIMETEFTEEAAIRMIEEREKAILEFYEKEENENHKI
ncbi:MAG: NUDIX domain-containing protein [Candidatus Nomurabacteria bacterium]|jgi:8-oxo-dGTP pyrophosphatase MutT (NUDIX family)|nr:NUDIX domain-containing protein [Candidatus Nomurabacteria bacterium]